MNSQAPVVLVTGASAGMGKDFVKALLAEGMCVYAVARRLEKMDDLAELGAITLKMDVTKEDDLQAVVQQIEEQHGGVDVLINNAGFGLFGAIEDVTLDEARYQFEVNLFGMARLIQLVLPSMRKKRSGKIINISSMGGRVYNPLGGDAAVKLLEKWNDYKHIGLIIGSQIQLSGLGVMGIAALSSETIEQAVRTVAKYISTNASFIRIETTSDKTHFHIQVEETLKNPLFQQEAIEVAMLIMQNIVEELGGKKLTTSKVCFSCPSTDYSEMYSDYFSGEILFNEEHNQIKIPISISSQPCAAANKTINQIALMECEQKLSNMNSMNLSIETILQLMQQPDKSVPSLEDIAAKYNISSRTLIRYLRSQSTTYRQLLDLVNKDIARRYLCDQKLSANKTAALLGYADTASFRRAFKRWFGCTPSQLQDRN